MSTVDKKTADKVIAGEFPEDNIYLIIQYKNAFNGELAYKLYYSSYMNLNLQKVGIEVLRIHGDDIKTYWIDEKRFPEKDVAVFKIIFPQVNRNEPPRDS